MPFGYPEDNPSAASLESKKKLELNEVPLSLLSFVLSLSFSLSRCLSQWFSREKREKLHFFFRGNTTDEEAAAGGRDGGREREEEGGAEGEGGERNQQQLLL